MLRFLDNIKKRFNKIVAHNNVDVDGPGRIGRSGNTYTPPRDIAARRRARRKAQGAARRIQRAYNA